MQQNPIFMPALDTTAVQTSSMLPPYPKASFGSTDLKKSFRGFLLGALAANEQLKQTAQLREAYGYPVELSGNADVLHVALRRWRTDLVQSLQEDSTEQSGDSVGGAEAKDLFEGTGIGRYLPMDPVRPEPVSFVDKIIKAERARNLEDQKALVNDLTNSIDFDRLTVNIQTLQQPADDLNLMEDYEDEMGMSPR